MSIKTPNKQISYTVFDLITAPALITAPPLDFLFYFHLLSPT